MFSCLCTHTIGIINTLSTTSRWTTKARQLSTDKTTIFSYLNGKIHIGVTGAKRLFLCQVCFSRTGCWERTNHYELVYSRERNLKGIQFNFIKLFFNLRSILCKNIPDQFLNSKGRPFRFHGHSDSHAHPTISVRIFGTYIRISHIVGPTNTFQIPSMHGSIFPS